ncbi:MAG: DMT family transporter [Hyphomicrobium sp.]|nr:DMT family transporter [Hyphomicrobium sp.]
MTTSNDKTTGGDPTPATGPAAGHDGDRVSAILLMMVAVTLFSGLDTAAKYLGQAYHMPVAQVSWSRFVVQFVLLLLFVPVFGGIGARELFLTKGLKLQLLRSVLMAATTVFNFLALGYLRLDQTITITFLTPLVVALLAGPLLGEWVGWRRMVAILVGFLGVVLAINPAVGGFHPAIFYSFAAVAAYAGFILLTRHMSGMDPPLVTLFYSMFVGTFFGAPVALVDWHAPPDLLAWLLLFSLGILGGVGHYLLLHAYRLAPASAVAPFLYFQLLSMVAFGYVVFGQLPDAYTIAGAAVVVASGIYLFHREHVTARAESALRRVHTPD